MLPINDEKIVFDFSSLQRAQGHQNYPSGFRLLLQAEPHMARYDLESRSTDLQNAQRVPVRAKNYCCHTGMCFATLEAENISNEGSDDEQRTVEFSG